MSGAKSGFFCIAMGIACAMAFVIGQENYVGMSHMPASSTSLLWGALGLLFARLFWAVFVQKKLRPRPVHGVFGLLFGVVNYFGTTLFAYDSWGFLNSPLAWGGAAIQWIGQGLPMMAALTLADDFLQKGSLTAKGAEREARFPRLRRFYEEHTTLCCAALFGLCWSPYLLVYFPGSLSWDIGEMLAQFFGLRVLGTWHPVFLTWVTGSFLWLGRLLGSDSLGMGLFMLAQAAVFALALGYTVQAMRRMGANAALQGAAVCFFALVPIWGAYAQFICKDTLYAAVLLLFTVETLLLLRGKTENHPRFWIRYGAWALFTCLFRNNGLYVIVPAAIILLSVGLRGKPRLWAAVTLGCAVLCATLFSAVLLPGLGVRDETAGGIYSVAFQQSARVLRDHGDTVTPEEYAEIDKVLDAENLPEKYEPWISDPVKYTLKQYGQGAVKEKEALAQYRKTWLAMLGKYPVIYLEAFVAGNSAYYAFTPKMEGETYNNQAGNRFVFETHPQTATHLDVHLSHLPGTEGLRTLLAAFARGWRHIPLLSLLLTCAAYTWALVAAGISIGRRRWRDLAGFAPALFSLAVCLLSPVNDYFRYFLPIVAMTLPLLTFAGGGEEKASA